MPTYLFTGVPCPTTGRHLTSRVRLGEHTTFPAEYAFGCPCCGQLHRSTIRVLHSGTPLLIIDGSIVVGVVVVGVADPEVGD